MKGDKLAKAQRIKNIETTKSGKVIFTNDSLLRDQLKSTYPDYE